MVDNSCDFGPYVGNVDFHMLNAYKFMKLSLIFSFFTLSFYKL